VHSTGQCQGLASPLATAQLNFQLAACKCRCSIDADGLLEDFYVSYSNGENWSDDLVVPHGRGLLTTDEEKLATDRALSYQRAQVFESYILFIYLAYITNFSN
jgi:hypothetical protein